MDGEAEGSFHGLRGRLRVGVRVRVIVDFDPIMDHLLKV